MVSRSSLLDVSELDMNKHIAVLMTCYNRVGTTLECLRRLFAQKVPDGYSFDVWLVDDASPDKTGEKVKATYPQVNVIQGTGKLFWCKGMRLAWDKASEAGDYDYYLWLNDDVMLRDCALSSVIDDCDKVELSVVVGTCSSTEMYSDVSYGATRTIPTGSPRVADKLMSGNFVLVPRNVYRTIGAICGSYHHQYGDYDYGNMLVRRGLQYYASSRFSGVCPSQPERYDKLNGKCLVRRLRLLFDERGYDIHDAFLYKLRSKGVLAALLSAFHVVFLVIKGGSK